MRTAREKPVVMEESECDARKIHDITVFYNTFFPSSLQSEEYKLKLYRNKSRKPVVLSITANGKIVGLLESWMSKEDPKIRILSTILVDPEARGKGYAKELFLQADEQARKDGESSMWVLHFRDSNKESLEAMYTSFGFTDLKQNGAYKNGEIKWEMTMPIEKQAS